MVHLNTGWHAAIVSALVLAGTLLIPVNGPGGALAEGGGHDLGGAEQLLFSTFLGADGSEVVRSIAVDGSGNVYVTGMTSSDTFPTTPGSYDNRFNGADDVYVAKLSANGSALLWSTYLGGSRNEWSTSICLDSRGDVVVSGFTSSSDFPTTAGTYDNTSNGESDVFVAKLDTNGSTLRFSTLVGGSKDDYGYAVLDDNDDIYISGNTYSTDYPTTVGAYDRNQNGGSNDLFVTKLAGNGSALVYSTYVGGGKEEYSHCPPAVDGAGNVYVTGYSASTDFPTVSTCYDTTLAAQYDAVVFKLDGTGGNLTASTWLGGRYYDQGMAVDLNVDGEVVVAGTSSSDDYPVTAGAADTSHNGYYDVIVSVLDEDLADLVGSTYLGGTATDYAIDVATDANGTVYLAGYTDSANYPIVPDSYDDTPNGLRDVHVTRLSADLGTLLNSTYLGGTAGDEGRSIALDPRNDIHVGVTTSSSGFPTTSGAFDTSHNGQTDAAVLKFRFPEDPNKFLDDDNDGVLNWEDAFPRNPYEYVDTDGDGVGDNLDPDADGDGTPDDSDDFPLDPSETRDTDRDGVGDNADTDDDDDGVNDTADAFPRDPSEILDSDGDGIGDNLDPDDDNDNVTDEQEFLDTLGRQFDNLSASLDLLGAILQGELDDVNASLLDTMEDLSDGFLDELSAVNSSLASSIQTTLASLMGSVEGLNVSISADIGDLDAWLAEVLAALDIQLARANATLHSHVTGLEGRTAGFYDALARDLAGISVNLTSARDQLSSNNKAIVDDIDALSDLMSDLHGTTLSELRDRLTTIGANLSSFDRATADRLTGIADDISAFEASLAVELEDLEMLGSILDDLEQLDTDLSAAQGEMEASVEDASSEEMGRLFLNMALLVVALVLLAVVVYVVHRSRGADDGTPIEHMED